MSILKFKINIIEYKRQKIKRVSLDMQKEFYDQVVIASRATGESVNGYIKQALKMRMEKEGMP